MEKVGILLISLVLAALVVWKLVLPNYHKKKYVRMVLWSVLALGFVSAGIQGPTAADKKAASSSSAQSSSKKESSAKTSNSKKESSTKASSSKKKADSINTKLMESLTEDQGFANGTLDENGNPTQNGTKNPQYNWATHVQKILWKDNGIEVYIYDAENLTESQLTTVAQSAQSAATATLLTEEKISDKESIQGIHTTVYSGNNVIGHSKAFSPKEFKWTK
ncbi:hypothetical protein [Limosilactobacillus mucosae]|uniref:hypothetical protein n=1 Tax=Limosilactobacillus mucosae TaxID=97478 RepID=UPI00233EA27E|nr:hypothetical protein [Limosilactobacillus mucosae]MDC2841643.1 hypothetical protein [Limosilactobacillus mucosae]